MVRIADGPRPEHYYRFSDQEFARRHAAVRQMMADEGIDALVGYCTSAQPANIRYLTGAAPHGIGVAYLVFPASGQPVLLLSNLGHVAGARALAVVPTEFWGTDSPAKVADYI